MVISLFKKKLISLVLITAIVLSVIPLQFFGFISLANGEKLWNGPKAYGGFVSVRGDLSPSGLGNPDQRDAKYFRHDLRFKNVITGQFSPSSNYYEAGGFELQPNFNEGPIKESGYFLAPLEESVIKNVVEKANGNPQFVWDNRHLFNLYSVDGSPYVSLWEVIFYSGGGGGHKEAENVGDGINSPLHRSVFDISPKPEVKEIRFSTSTVKQSELANHKLSIETVAYSANWEVNNITRLYITGPNLDNVRLAISDQVSPKKEGSYTSRVKQDFPLDFLKGLQAGTYTVRVETSDPFGRFATPKSAQITILEEGTNPPPEPEPEPEPEPVLNPPVASLSATNIVMVGNDATIKLTGTAFDGATIEHYAIEVPGSMTGNIDSYSNTSFKGDYITWYSKAGDYDVYGRVWDSNGQQSDIVSRTIKVIPPAVAPIINVGGTLKENRKVILTDASIGPQRFPVDHNITEWQIEAISGGTNDDIKYDGVLKGPQIDVLFKKAGQYRITLTAYINVFGEVISGTTSQIITIQPDLPPIVDFEAISPQLRDPSLDNIAILKITDKSYSLDGDHLNLTYRYAYDSNNDGSFSDQSWITVPSSQIKDGIVEIPVGNNVGKYMIEASAVESYGQPTIEKFITDDDYRRGDTSEKPVVEKIIDVQNLAPITDITEANLTGKTKKIDVAINLKNPFIDKAAIKEQINNVLKNAYQDEDMDAKLYILEDTSAKTADVFLGDGIHFLKNYQGNIYIVTLSLTYDRYGRQLLSSSTFKSELPNLTILKNIKYITRSSESGSHYIMIDENDDAYTWGYNYYGQLGDGTTTDRTYEQRYKVMSNVKQVVAGNQASYILDKSGNLYAFGFNLGSQIGNGNQTNQLTPYKIPISNIQKIAVGYGYVLALDDNGDVWVWGNNGYGQLGIEDNSLITTPVKLSSVTNVVDIAAGYYHSLLLTKDNVVYGMGYNGYYQMGPVGNLNVPTQILDDVIQIGVTTYGSWFLTSENKLYYSGMETDDFHITSPRVIETDVQSFYTNKDNSVIFKSNNEIIITFTRPGNSNNYLARRNLNTFKNFKMYADQTTNTIINGIEAVQWRTDAAKFYVDFYNSMDYLDEDSLTQTALKLSDKGIHFVAINSIKNKEKIRKIIDLNNGYGRYIAFGNIPDLITQIKAYTIQRKPVDIYVNIRNTAHDDIKLLKQKIEAIVRPLLDSYSLEANIILTDGERIPENRLFYIDNNNYINVYDNLNNTNSRLINTEVIWAYVADDGYLYYTVNSTSGVDLYKYNLTTGQSHFVRMFFDPVYIYSFMGIPVYATPNQMKDFIIHNGKLYANRIYYVMGSEIQSLIEHDLKKDKLNVIGGGGHFASSFQVSPDGLIYYTFRDADPYVVNNYLAKYNPKLEEYIVQSGARGVGNYYASSTGYVYYYYNNLYPYFFRNGNGTGNTAIGATLTNGSKVFGYNGIVYFSGDDFPMMNAVGGFYKYNETTYEITPILIKQAILKSMTPDKKIWYTLENALWTYDTTTDTHIKTGLSSSIINNINHYLSYHPHAETRRLRKYGIEETLNAQYWRTDAASYYVYIDDGANSELTNATTRNKILDKLNENYTQFIGLGTSANKAAIETLTNQLDYSTYIDNTNLDQALNDLAIHIINTAGLRKRNIEQYVLINEEVEFTTTYEDKESDPLYDERWKLTHDPAVFDNSLGMYQYSGQYISSPPSYFDKTGKYDIIYNARDNPKNHNAFDNYRLWSADPATKFTLYAHRRPIADFEALAIYNASTQKYQLTIYDNSYDLDHTSMENKGIVQRRWSYRTASDPVWKTGQPTQLSIAEVYFLRLEVKDLEGVWSYPTIKQVSFADNLPPRVAITVPSSANPSIPTQFDTLTPTIKWKFVDDDTGDSQSKYRVFIYQNSNDKLIYDSGEVTSSSQQHAIPSFANLKEEIVYRVDVKVADTRGVWNVIPAEAKYFTIIINRPPNVTITTSPAVKYEGDTITVSVTATDPDGDKLNLKVEQRKNGGSWTTIWTKNNVSSGSQQSFTIPNAEVGSYELRATATDPKNASATTTISYQVFDLSVTGFVKHTDEWNSKRIKYNTESTGNPDNPRPYKMFWSGEGFVLEATTTNTTTDTKAIRVTAQLNFQYLNYAPNPRSNIIVNLTYDSIRKLWNGYEADLDNFQYIKNGEYDVLFTAQYSNGHIEYDVVRIQIQDPWNRYTDTHRRK